MAQLDFVTYLYQFTWLPVVFFGFSVVVVFLRWLFSVISAALEGFFKSIITRKKNYLRFIKLKYNMLILPAVTVFPRLSNTWHDYIDIGILIPVVIYIYLNTSTEVPGNGDGDGTGTGTGTGTGDPNGPSKPPATRLQNLISLIQTGKTLDKRRADAIKRKAQEMAKSKAFEAAQAAAAKATANLNTTKSAMWFGILAYVAFMILILIDYFDTQLKKQSEFTQLVVWFCFIHIFGVIMVFIFALGYDVLAHILDSYK